MKNSKRGMVNIYRQKNGEKKKMKRKGNNWRKEDKEMMKRGDKYKKTQ